MNIREIKVLPGSEVELVGEISVEEFESYRNEAIKDVSENMKLDGFRPGKIPEKVILAKLGEEIVLEKMAYLALQKAYIEAIAQKKIKAIGRPEVSILKLAKGNPLEFKAKTAVLPEVKLPDYRDIALKIVSGPEKKEIQVEEKELNEVLDYLRKSRAEKNEKGEEILPELDDEFAKKIGKFENLEALKKILTENIKEEKTEKEHQKKRAEILDKITKESEMEIPRIMVESEKRRMKEEMKANISQMGLKWEDYLKHLNKTEEELEQGWDRDALNRAKQGLVMDEIAQKEKIEIPEDELNAETDRMVEYYSNHYKNIDREQVKAYTYNVIKNEKVFKFLEGVK